MIVRPTVFVLGAGASKPYGFPVGYQLAERVCALMPNTLSDVNHQPLNELRNWELSNCSDDFSTRLAAELPNRFAESGCETLDEFVQAPANRRFLPLVKAGIIRVLSQQENDATLYPKESNRRHAVQSIRFREGGYEEDDWVRYLFLAMRTDDPEAFRANRVKVITFNFDRSFERKAFLMLKATYGLSVGDAASLSTSIPVLHIHGSLGAPSWLQPQGGRDYLPNPTHQEIQSIYRDIKIVLEEVPPERIARCRDWVDAAHTIVFLGFGYHQTNVKRLTLDEDRPTTKNILGTAYGLTDPEARRAHNRFGNNVRPHLKVGKTSLALLREEHDAMQTELN